MPKHYGRLFGPTAKERQKMIRELDPKSPRVQSAQRRRRKIREEKEMKRIAKGLRPRG